VLHYSSKEAEIERQRPAEAFEEKRMACNQNLRQSGGMTMLFVYPAIFHKEEDMYWVEFPDLEGCHTYGSSINETLETAQEALAAYLLTLLEQGKALPSPSDISSISVEDGFSSLVSCDIDQYKDTKAVKKTLTIPSWLNDRAVSMGVNFSRVLQEALLSKIQS
jgi:antitoxin HicB